MRRSVLPLALAAAFGAGDQLLGARAWLLGPWAIDASLLSAPWVLVAFLAGWTQPTARRAVVFGVLCTLAALAGYCAMTLSPIEGAVVTLRGVGGLLAGQVRWVAGGLLTGPLFGWLGHRWRMRRDWRCALAAALVVCCEPLAHLAAGTPVNVRWVWAAEVVAGAAVALYALAVIRRRASAA